MEDKIQKWRLLGNVPVPESLAGSIPGRGAFLSLEGIVEGESESHSRASRNIGCVLAIVQLVFVAMRLVGVEPVATWPWALVFAPTIMPVILAASLFMIFLAIGVMFSAFKRR